MSSPPVSLNGSRVQQFAARILTILKPGFVASIPDEVDQISVSEIASSITLESDYELCTCEFLMKCSTCLSFSRMLMPFQFTDKFRVLGFPVVSATVFVGS